MQRLKGVVAGSVIGALCLLSFPVAAQQVGPQSRSGSLTDDDFISLHQQIKELKNPTFRAFLRSKLLSLNASEPNATRRQLDIAVATQGITDLCAHQDQIWTPTASWLHGKLAKQIKTLRSSEETAPAICTLQTETSNNAAKEFASGIKLLSNPETSAAGLQLAKTAILSGQVSSSAMLGQLTSPTTMRSPHSAELLSALLELEESRPGTLTLRLMPFFSPAFFDKSVSPEISTRFLRVAVRASRVPAAELTNPVVRSSVWTLLNGIAHPAQRLTPELYPEIASRLGSLSSNGLKATEARLAAQERIEKANDQLEQLIFEANSASDESLKKHFFFLAARMAKEQGHLSKAVDLAAKNGNNSATWFSDFLSEIVSQAIKNKSPREANYAIAQITQPLKKANAFRLLGEYYGASHDQIKSNEAFAESIKQLKALDNSNEKVQNMLLLAESVLMYGPTIAYEVFREAVKAINNLPSPEPDQEKMFYVKLMPVAEDLIRSFHLLAAHEKQTATSLAAEIKLPELRVSALSGVYTSDKL